MMRVFQPRLATVALLNAALAFVWVAGAHQHLCFDGLQPPATLHHLVDGRDHRDHHGPESGHSDVDVELDTSLTRAPTSGADAPAILARVAGVFAAVVSTGFARLPSAPSAVRTAPRLRQPPLRAPPA